MIDSVVGLGFGGSRVAHELKKILNLKAYYFNLAKVDLKSFYKDNKLFKIEDDKPNDGNILLLDSNGTGKDPLMALGILNKNRVIAREFVHSIQGKNIIVCVGLGGGSGTGSIEYFLDILVRKAENVILVATLPSDDEGIPTKPNALKYLNIIHENYVKTHKLTTFLVDNGYVVKKYGTHDFNKVNKLIGESILSLYIMATSKFMHFDFEKSYGSLDLNDLKKIFFDKSGYSDIRTYYIKPEDLMKDDKLGDIRSKIRLGSDLMSGIDIWSTKKYLVNISIPYEFKDNERLFQRSAKLFEIIARMTNSPYVFKSSNYDKTITEHIRVKLLLSGLQPPRGIKSLMNQAIREVNKFKEKSQEVQSLDLDLTQLGV